MYNNLLSEHENVPPQSFHFGEALRQLPLQYIKVLTKPSLNTLSEVIEQASWSLVLVQFLILVVSTVFFGYLGLAIPGATLHNITTLSIGSVRPFEWLPLPLNGIAFVLMSFLIGLVTAYVGSRACKGQGTLLAHCYCLLLCTVPLVIVSGTGLLIPATGWLLWSIGSSISMLFIYRMILHAMTIMAVHRLRTSQATLIVLILPIIILIIIVIVGLLYFTHGEGWDIFGIGGGGDMKRRRKKQIPLQ